MRIGLVLGAGGSVGVAYHGAVLAAIEEATGWDPRTADLVVGTSAGSISGSLLRAGVPAADLRRISEGESLSSEGAELAGIGRPHRPRANAAHFIGMRPFADPVGVLRGITHPGGHLPAATVAALLPAGRVPTEAISAGINAVFAAGWPTKDLWLCTVDLREGRRVVFGRRGAPEARVGDAVAASCAIPGYFRPVVIGGRRYVDGGVHSMVNLDLAGESALDLVIVSSPMSCDVDGPSLAADMLMRRPLRARLHAEISALRRRGAEVVAIEPSQRVVGAMGLNPMDARSRGRVSRAAHASVLDWLTRGEEGRRLVSALSAKAPGGRVAI